MHIHCQRTCLQNHCLVMVEWIHLQIHKESRLTAEELLEALFSLQNNYFSFGRQIASLPESFDSKVWLWVPWDLEPKVTVLAGTSSNYLTRQPWLSSQSQRAETRELQDLIMGCCLTMTVSMPFLWLHYSGCKASCHVYGFVMALFWPHYPDFQELGGGICRHRQEGDP
jgi:hypothetical protein